MKMKKIPLRKCIGCNESKPKSDLIRVVRTTDGNIEIDETGRVNGRGAYICKNKDCFNKAEKADKISKALETEVTKEKYESLKELIE